MKYTEVKDLSSTELKKKMKAVEADIFKAKMKNSIGQLQNPLQIRDMRKDYARLSTALAKTIK